MSVKSMEKLKELQEQLGNVVVNELMTRHTTFKIGGPAEYFFKASTKEQVLTALKAAQELRIPYIVLGLGSNVLVADAGFDGLVIQISNMGVKVEGECLRA